MISEESIEKLKGKKIGFAVCGSFCTFSKAFKQLQVLKDAGADLTPIMSYNAYSTDTKFGTSESHRKFLTETCGKPIISDIAAAEPIGPKRLFDLLIIAPCTGNTISKLALDIIDTPVTMAVKSHIRNERPVLIALSTNDALSGCARNIGDLMNRRCFYFVPICQDDSEKKPRSAAADFTKIPENIERISLAYSVYGDDPRQNFSKVKGLTFTLKGKNTLVFSPDNLLMETTIVAVEFYRYKNNWKLCCVGAGYRDGLRRLCESTGLQIV